MVLNLKKLNSKEKKKIMQILKDNYGFDSELNYLFLFKEKKGKIYLLNKEFEDIDLETLKVDSLGVYFGTLMDKDKIRLSIEGSQIIGPNAKKNVFEINEGMFKLWVRGYPITINPDIEGFIILKHKEDYLGCGKYVLADDRIHNYVPKARRVMSED